MQHTPPKAQIHPWEWTKRPCSRLEINFAGPVQGPVFLIIVNSYSKWLEVAPVKLADSLSVIQVIRSLFVTHRLPDTMISDNDSAFSSALLQEFAKSNVDPIYVRNMGRGPKRLSAVVIEVTGPVSYKVLTTIWTCCHIDRLRPRHAGSSGGATLQTPVEHWQPAHFIGPQQSTEEPLPDGSEVFKGFSALTAPSYSSDGSEGLQTTTESCLQDSSNDAASPSVLPQASQSDCVTTIPQIPKIKPFSSKNFIV
ncbi:hypothetical protein PR048_011113 [Dryococelus australis]|uniref:Integrase catalytic domain-containing protein n=1 Tax=Dryococelus australis TaxID=614101 RepID=A0ABQ9HKZ9_9NEOP|nr:hypothetical protein PR048_011113 [Dryococelus australis]